MLISIFLISCGQVATKVSVRQNADNTQTTISIRNGEGASTSVSVNPKIADSLITIINNN